MEHKGAFEVTMSDQNPVRNNYYVYVYRIGGIMAYVGKGSGWRMNRHKKASHNRNLNEWIAFAKLKRLPIVRKVIKRGLTNEAALQFEAKCYRKWQSTICNLNDPWPLLEWEQEEDEWQEYRESEEYASSMFGHTDRWLDAVHDFNDRKLSRPEAIEFGLIEADNEEYVPLASAQGD